jgi:tRNA (cmo5U34)-methyltransferase
LRNYHFDFRPRPADNRRVTRPIESCWQSADHALAYLARADRLPHRAEGEAALLEHLPAAVSRVLDLGSGDGRLLGLVRLARPGIDAVALDFSATMLERLRARFERDGTVAVVAHDLARALPALGSFDAVVSSFAIHHLPHARKRALYEEVFAALAPGGVFLNLEHVASPTSALHGAFLHAIGFTPAEEDPDNKLLDVQTQIEWLREIGFADADCHWKWRELALLAGRRA